MFTTRVKGSRIAITATGKGVGGVEEAVVIILFIIWHVLSGGFLNYSSKYQ